MQYVFSTWSFLSIKAAVDSIAFLYAVSIHSISIFWLKWTICSSLSFCPCTLAVTPSLVVYQLAEACRLWVEGTKREHPHPLEGRHPLWSVAAICLINALEQSQWPCILAWQSCRRRERRWASALLLNMFELLSKLLRYVNVILMKSESTWHSCSAPRF